GSGFEFLASSFYVLATEIEQAQRKVRLGRLGVQSERCPEFTFRPRLILLPRRERTKGDMISCAILILFSQALNLLADVIDVVRRHSRVGEEQDCSLVVRLFFENLQGGVAGLRQFPQTKKDLAKFKLDLPVLRAQLRGPLEQRIGL